MSYTIQSGDTFWAIAQSHGTSVDAIQAANPGVDPNNLQIGANINLPGGSGGASAPSGGSGGQYTIQSGDTFWALAQSHGTTVDAIQAANPGVNPTALSVGQQINMP